MANEDLRSAISQMQNECNRLASENSAMQSQINAICSSAQSAANSLARTRNKATNALDSSRSVIEQSDEIIRAVAAEQDNIGDIYRGFKNIETANKKIRDLNNKIYFEFVNFRMVRKIVRAFIDNVNLDIVKPEIIFKSIEKEHLQSPDFWLSCSMLAIMHWKDDDKDGADRAIKQALELDSRQTTLFFMSFNLLLGRKDAALKWFECYEKEEKSGADANVVLLLLHAINLRQEENDKLTEKIKEFLINQYEISKELNDEAEIVRDIRNHLVNGSGSALPSFNALRNYLKDYSEMSYVLTKARDTSAILGFVEATNTAPRSKGYIYIEKFINEILDTPDKKEKQYTDEIAYNEEIIRCVGDLALADSEWNKKHDHEVAPLNLMQECVTWLFYTSGAEISDVARSNMFLLCKDLIEKAFDDYVKDYRSKMKYAHPAVIKDYATTLDFNAREREIQKAELYYDNKKKAQLAAVKNTAIVLAIVFAVLCVAGAIVSVVFSLIPLMIVALVAAAACGVSAFVTNIRNKKKRDMICKKAIQDTENCTKILNSIFVDFDAYVKSYQEYDRVVEQVNYAVKR